MHWRGQDLNLRPLDAVSTYINGLHRDSETLNEGQEFTDSFWVRPGEKVGLSVSLFHGVTVVTLMISFDEVPVAGPRNFRPESGESCDLWATA